MFGCCGLSFSGLFFILLKKITFVIVDLVAEAIFGLVVCFPVASFLGLPLDFVAAFVDPAALVALAILVVFVGLAALAGLSYLDASALVGLDAAAYALDV